MKIADFPVGNTQIVSLQRLDVIGSVKMMAGQYLE